MTRQLQKAVTRFGKEFRGQYGWAAHHLKLSQPGFGDLERAAGIDHLRSYSQMASYNVHANAKGIFWKLGLMPETQLLLAGSSNVGLADPGQSAALSLVQVTTVFATLQPSLDNNVAV